MRTALTRRVLGVQSSRAGHGSQPSSIKSRASPYLHNTVETHLGTREANSRRSTRTTASTPCPAHTCSRRRARAGDRTPHTVGWLPPTVRPPSPPFGQEEVANHKVPSKTCLSGGPWASPRLPARIIAESTGGPARLLDPWLTPTTSADGPVTINTRTALHG